MGSACRCTIFQVPSSGRKIIVARVAIGTISSLPPTLALARSSCTTQASSAVTYFATISEPTNSPSLRNDAACSMVLATSSNPRTGGPQGLARVTSSLWDHSFFTGSGFPLTNSPAASCHCSISWSTSSTADICRDHLHRRWQMLLSLRTHSLPVAEALKPITLYSPECVEEFSEVGMQDAV